MLFNNFDDRRHHYFHIYVPGRPHRWEHNLTKFAGFANTFYIEDVLVRNSDLIHRNLSRWHYSFYISIIYLISIILLKNYMKNRRPYQLRAALFIWNVSLAIFSILGTIRCLPEFIDVIWNHGLEHSYSKSTYYYDYRIVAWYLLFALSKSIELFDTGFILLRKKRLIVLHWIHHLLTLNYTWFVYPDAPATGRWMCTMNYLIHSLMYTYYAVRVLNIHVPRKLSLCLTTAQISQMFAGLYVNYQALKLKTIGVPCDASFSVLITGVILYGLFAILFINFFIWTYIINNDRTAEMIKKQNQYCSKLFRFINKKSQ